jgi:hypothetical protein
MFWNFVAIDGVIKNQLDKYATGCNTQSQTVFISLFRACFVFLSTKLQCVQCSNPLRTAAVRSETLNISLETFRSSRIKKRHIWGFELRNIKQLSDMTTLEETHIAVRVSLSRSNSKSHQFPIIVIIIIQITLNVSQRCLCVWEMEQTYWHAKQLSGL